MRRCFVIAICGWLVHAPAYAESQTIPTMLVPPTTMPQEPAEQKAKFIPLATAHFLPLKPKVEFKPLPRRIPSNAVSAEVPNKPVTRLAENAMAARPAHPESTGNMTADQAKQILSIYPVSELE